MLLLGFSQTATPTQLQPAPNAGDTDSPILPQTKSGNNSTATSTWVICRALSFLIALPKPLSTGLSLEMY